MRPTRSTTFTSSTVQSRASKDALNAAKALSKRRNHAVSSRESSQRKNAAFDSLFSLIPGIDSSWSKEKKAVHTAGYVSDLHERVEDLEEEVGEVEEVRDYSRCLFKVVCGLLEMRGEGWGEEMERVRGVGVEERVRELVEEVAGMEMGAGGVAEGGKEGGREEDGEYHPCNNDGGECVASQW